MDSPYAADHAATSMAVSGLKTRVPRVWHEQEYKAGSEALTQYNYASQGPIATGNRWPCEAEPGEGHVMHSSGRELRVKPPNRQCGRPCPCVVGESTTVILACLLALVCIGCASIESFRASPRRACVGDAVTVTWAATGDVVRRYRSGIAGRWTEGVL